MKYILICTSILSFNEIEKKDFEEISSKGKFNGFRTPSTSYFIPVTFQSAHKKSFFHSSFLCQISINNHRNKTSRNKNCSLITFNVWWKFPWFSPQYSSMLQKLLYLLFGFPITHFWRHTEKKQCSENVNVFFSRDKASIFLSPIVIHNNNNSR